MLLLSSNGKQIGFSLCESPNLYLIKGVKTYDFNGELDVFAKFVATYQVSIMLCDIVVWMWDYLISRTESLDGVYFINSNPASVILSELIIIKINFVVNACNEGNFFAMILL